MTLQQAKRLVMAHLQKWDARDIAEGRIQWIKQYRGRERRESEANIARHMLGSIRYKEQQMIAFYDGQWYPIIP